LSSKLGGLMLNNVPFVDRLNVSKDSIFAFFALLNPDFIGAKSVFVAYLPPEAPKGAPVLPRWKPSKLHNSTGQTAIVFIIGKLKLMVNCFW